MSIDNVGWLTKTGAVILKTIINSPNFRAERRIVVQELEKYLPEESNLVLSKLPDMETLIDLGIVVDHDPYYELNGSVHQSRIQQVNEELDKVIAGVEEVGVAFDDDSLRMPTDDEVADAVKKITKELLIDSDVIKQIIASLVAGKHILLTGPVGTGKTHLANILPGLVWKDNDYKGYHCKVVTANSEWTTQDVIGGILPKVIDEEDEESNGDKITNKVTYQIQDGCVIETIKNNYDKTLSSRHDFEIDDKKYRGQWLVIDEFNRANIDRAFGPLFTAIQGFSKNVLYPTTDPDKTSEEIKIPEDYRIIGTLNTADKHFLNQLSFALKRRFDIISIEPPTMKEADVELRMIAKRGLEELQKTISEDDLQKTDYKEYLEILFDVLSFIRTFQPLGTAFPISMFQFMITNYFLTKNWMESIDLAFTRQILPQLEQLDVSKLQIIREFCMGTIAKFYVEFDRTKRRNEIPEFAKILGMVLEFRENSGKQPTGKKRSELLIPTEGNPEPIVSEPKMWSEEFRQGEKFNVSESTPSDDYNRLLNELDLDLNPWYRPDVAQGLHKPHHVILSNFAKGVTKLISEKTYSGE